MKKICVVSTSIPPDYSGAGLAAYRYSQRLFNQNCLAFICTRTREPIDNYTKSIIFRITKLRSISETKFVNRTINYLYSILDPIIVFVKIAYILVKKYNNYDIIHCFAPTWLSFFAIIIGKLLGKKIVLEITLLGTDDPFSLLQKKHNYLFYFKRVLQYRFSNIIVCLSPALVKSCLDYGISERKIYLNPRSVDINIFSPITEGKKIMLKQKITGSDNTPILLFVGSLIERKGAQFIVPITIELKLKYKNIKILIIGNSDINKEEVTLAQKIQFDVKKFDLVNNIEFLGLKKDIKQYYNVADALLFLSKREGLPNVILESMACGTPVIASQIDGITDFIISNKQDGFLINSYTPVDYAKSFIDLYENKQYYQTISRNARIKIENNFSNHIIDSKYQEIYSNV